MINKESYTLEDGNYVVKYIVQEEWEVSKDGYGISIPKKDAVNVIVEMTEDIEEYKKKLNRLAWLSRWRFGKIFDASQKWSKTYHQMLHLEYTRLLIVNCVAHTEWEEYFNEFISNPLLSNIFENEDETDRSSKDE